MATQQQTQLMRWDGAIVHRYHGWTRFRILMCYKDEQYVAYMGVWNNSPQYAIEAEFKRKVNRIRADFHRTRQLERKR